ncbi:GTP cyclohydrolase-2 [Pyronema domesticum]|uniref:GTP cyclohydrolase II n=1 Tax=Pyronema omphalodes (strain CBS 100304) TaxID=1076935 RepID=U4LDG6_PYROM|nr:GTP cyclohydrolase-2 [Pyronema domesticum]CCX30154.1 Similar to Probable GTP cyclohydrolase-2; acc. no. Q9P7M9 [Pyronema omphalodes CBS 100304]
MDDQDPPLPSTIQHLRREDSSTHLPLSPLSMPSVLSPLPSLGYLHDLSGTFTSQSSRPSTPGSPGGYSVMSRTSSFGGEGGSHGHGGSGLPSIISPAFTPSAVPGTPNLGPMGDHMEDNKETKVPKKLMKELPEVQCIVRARIPTTTGTEIFLHLYQNSIDTKEHLAIVFGDRIRSKSLDAVRPGETEMDRMIRGAYTGRLRPGRTDSSDPNQGLQGNPAHLPTCASSTSEQRSQAPLVRIHSECYTGEIAWSARCDCGEQLDEAARLMSLDPAGGAVVYLRQEGRGIGLGEKLKAYNLQDLGNDTVQANLLLRHPADARSYGLATAILMDLGLNEVRLLTNNPEKIAAVEGGEKQIRVVERVPMIPLAWKNMKGGVTGREVGEYLKTKILHMGHLLTLPEDEMP